MSRCFVLLSVLLLVVAAGCDMGAKRISAPSMNAATVAKAALAEFDTNGDGKISGKELDKCSALKISQGRLDPKGEGITAKTIEDLIKGWQETKIGRTSCPCQVSRNGKPLADATVTFVPEKFLGPNYQVASGKTDATGIAQITLPNVTPLGLPLGFYRVQITKEGENIPAKFNTETELGAGLTRFIAAGFGARFNLNY
jgi:hypothetical protein